MFREKMYLEKQKILREKMSELRDNQKRLRIRRNERCMILRLNLKNKEEK